MFKKIKHRIIKGRQLQPFPTAKVIQEHEDRITTLEGGEAGELVDISALKETVGDADSGLVKDVNTLKTSKANSNHTHTLSNVSDLEVVEVVLTKADSSTETVYFVKQTQSP